jgi:hypothetical protein
MRVSHSSHTGVDLPNQTLILSLVGAAFLGSYVLSLFKLFLDLTIRSGTDVSCLPLAVSVHID